MRGFTFRLSSQWCLQLLQTSNCRSRLRYLSLLTGGQQLLTVMEVWPHLHFIWNLPQDLLKAITRANQQKCVNYIQMAPKRKPSALQLANKTAQKFHKQKQRGTSSTRSNANLKPAWLGVDDADTALIQVEQGIKQMALGLALIDLAVYP